MRSPVLERAKSDRTARRHVQSAVEAATRSWCPAPRASSSAPARTGGAQGHHPENRRRRAGRRLDRLLVSDPAVPTRIKLDRMIRKVRQNRFVLVENQEREPTTGIRRERCALRSTTAAPSTVRCCRPQPDSPGRGREQFRGDIPSSDIARLETEKIPMRSTQLMSFWSFSSLSISHLLKIRDMFHNL